jgi:hypothetical protein
MGPIPAGLAGLASDLWVYDRRIEQVMRLLDTIYQGIAGGGSAHGVGSLEKLLADLMKRRAEIRPVPPPSADEEEQRWRGDAKAVIRAIEQGVVEAEQRAARAA